MVSLCNMPTLSCKRCLYFIITGWMFTKTLIHFYFQPLTEHIFVVNKINSTPLFRTLNNRCCVTLQQLFSWAQKICVQIVLHMWQQSQMVLCSWKVTVSINSPTAQENVSIDRLSYLMWETCAFQYCLFLTVKSSYTVTQAAILTCGISTVC